MKKNISTKDKILDISLNLARVGNWTADAYDQKKQLIARFMVQTQDYINNLSDKELNSLTRPVFKRFKKEFQDLRTEKIEDENKYSWAERALTWANILQHRSGRA
ncbi:MAG: hypothetical protein AAB531_03585 [Patescibacteria group bacterium]